jgi:hypothetical protein
MERRERGEIWRIEDGRRAKQASLSPPRIPRPAFGCTAAFLGPSSSMPIHAPSYNPKLRSTWVTIPIKRPKANTEIEEKQKQNMTFKA